MINSSSVEGDVAAGFESVRALFDEQVAQVGAGGAAFAAVVEGRLVVDLWAGRAGSEPWRRETRGVLMSTTKGVTATAVALLIDRGELDVEAPVARYWPEFAAGGKAEITVAQLLSHSAGLVTIPGYEDLLSPDGEGWDRTEEIVRRLESAVPEWEPGSTHGYHALTIGWLVGELVRRIAGRSVGALIREEIAGPLGLELDLGTPPERQHLVAPPILPGSQAATPDESGFADPELWTRAILAVDGRSILDTAPEFFTNPTVLALELSGSNATATARATATLFGTLANGGERDGVRLLSPETIAAASAERRRGPDRIFGTETRWALGFACRVADPAVPASWWGPYDESFGATGYGGQIAFADPVSRVGVGFVRSELVETGPLGGQLVHALYECLDAT
jgi:CubicO group peptidase (beta-lactamase class C family)